MVKCLKLKKELGEKTIKELKDQNNLNREYPIGNTGTFLLIPIKNSSKISTKLKHEIVERNLKKTKDVSPKKFKTSLEKILSKEQIEKINNSFDIVGDIAVIDFDESLKNLETTIAWTFKRTHKNIKVVAKRGKRTEGKYRIRKIKPLVGEKRTETIHKESGIKLKIDLNKAYFSSRLGQERLRILNQIKENEKVMVMFAGIGPYPILIAKNKNAEVYANEINPAAVKLMKENIILNKLKNKIKLIPGDAHKEIPKLKEKFNRIIMPLPHSAQEFLKDALSISKQGTIIHLYQFEHNENLKRKEKEIIEAIKKLNFNAKILKVAKTGEFGPGINRYCFDIKVQ